MLYKGKHYSLAEFHSSPVIQASTPAVTIESKPMRTQWKPPDNHPWKRPVTSINNEFNRHVMQLKIRITKMLASAGSNIIRSRRRGYVKGQSRPKAHPDIASSLHILLMASGTKTMG